MQIKGDRCGFSTKQVVSAFKFPDPYSGTRQGKSFFKVADLFFKVEEKGLLEVVVPPVEQGHSQLQAAHLSTQSITRQREESRRKNVGSRGIWGEDLQQERKSQSERTREKGQAGGGALHMAPLKHLA